MRYLLKAFLFVILISTASCVIFYPSMVGSPGVTHSPGAISIGAELQVPTWLGCFDSDYETTCFLLPNFLPIPLLGGNVSIGLPLESQLDLDFVISGPAFNARLLKLLFGFLSVGPEVSFGSSESSTENTKINFDYTAFKLPIIFAFPSAYSSSKGYIAISPQYIQINAKEENSETGETTSTKSNLFMTALSLGYALDTPGIRLRTEFGIEFQPAKRSDGTSETLIGYHLGISLGFYISGKPLTKTAKLTEGIKLKEK